MINVVNRLEVPGGSPATDPAAYRGHLVKDGADTPTGTVGDRHG
ncbi:hypothetical protein [Rhizohabitans arisaemae]|nr:hypothetical protein [Rhizohabitans arisaemae]